jgi:hypothetical protein
MEQVKEIDLSKLTSCDSNSLGCYYLYCETCDKYISIDMSDVKPITEIHDTLYDCLATFMDEESVVYMILDMVKDNAELQELQQYKLFDIGNFYFDVNSYYELTVELVNDEMLWVEDDGDGFYFDHDEAMENKFYKYCYEITEDKEEEIKPYLNSVGWFVFKGIAILLLDAD